MEYKKKKTVEESKTTKKTHKSTRRKLASLMDGNHSRSNGSPRNILNPPIKTLK